MSLTPEHIQGKRFHDAFRGYNHEEVDGFLDQVASSFVAVNGELQTARRQVARGGRRSRRAQALPVTGRRTPPRRWTGARGPF